MDPPSIPGDLRFTSFACQLIGHNYRRIYDALDVSVIRAGALFPLVLSRRASPMKNYQRFPDLSLDGSSWFNKVGSHGEKLHFFPFSYSLHFSPFAGISSHPPNKTRTTGTVIVLVRQFASFN